MNGNDRTTVILQERDLRLFRALAAMRVVDREQSMMAAGFGSITRVNTRLLALTRAGLLHRFRLGVTAGSSKAIYSLTTKSAKLIGAQHRGPRRVKDEVLFADYFVQHRLVINEIRCALEYRALPEGIGFRCWRDFYVPLAPELHLIPDGYAELQTQSGIVANFLEVDLGNETMTVWKEKVANYLRLAVAGDCIRLFNQSRFRVLVVASTERRVQAIRKVVNASTQKIFWFATVDAVRTRGLFAPVWLRPAGGNLQPLVQ